MASFAGAGCRAALCAAALALLVACGGSSTKSASHAFGSSTPASSAPAAASASAVARLLTPADIAARGTPSVVSIRSPNSLGSGFVVRKDGWIATNLHVIAEARELSVTFAGGAEFPVVEVIAIDVDHDLALIKIDKAALPELVVGDSDRVKAGDRIVAIGHPLGLEDTVSNGLVSAIRIVSPKLTLLQISAPIAPGSSGGPLIDEEGSVIGIATAVSREGQNVAFGVPTRYLAELIDKPAPLSWADFVAARSAASLPAVKRDVPHHELSMLTGCGEGDLKLVAQMLSDAIEVGAPLFNRGNFAACFHVYEGASADAEHKLGAGCSGPKRALAAGRTKADTLRDPSAQAWAMRDSFDGLLDVIVRKLDHP